jgi:hypothetical protein
MNQPITVGRGQPQHFLALLILLVLTWWGWERIMRPEPLAFWIAVSFPVAHQVFVWLSWRAELGWRGMSKTIGFDAYLVLFFILFLGRFVSLGALAWLDRDSLGISMAVRVGLTAVLALPGLYAMYSVHRYFGLRRAAGADHFDEKYRSMPLVREGIFRFTDNAMYTYAFLLFWAIAVALASKSALVVAAFSHLYIWVHYHCTEKPDMASIYAGQ